MGHLRRPDFPAMIQRIERKNMDPANQNQNSDDNEAKKPENTGGEDWQSKFEGQRKVNRDLEKKLNEAYAKADKVDELEKQIAALQGKEAEYEAARKEQAVKDEALAAANQRILKAEVRAAASGKLTDPADALRYLDLSKFTVTADGGVDSQAIANSIGELLEQKPYLGKAEQSPSGANITPPSGTRDGDRHQGQLTRDDLKTMSPAEIVKAQQDGRLKDLLGAN
nr:MAG TPA: minor structural protein [Caudoviricetes sp.]